MPPKVPMMSTSTHTPLIKDYAAGALSEPATRTGHASYVYSLAVLPSGMLASGSNDNSIKVWDVQNQTCIATLPGHTGTVNSLVVLPSGMLASGSLDNSIKVWDVGRQTCIATLTGHMGGVRSLVVLPSGMLASSSYDKYI